ncbi:MAG: hypothetical protein EZS28_021907 [Streblomastix strix]|uniref:Uncharacterized protein n=1 Tax=Streblomastix strix TaxID=222440 RepID=A0A5J4VIU1_9EUKA|nr:MAG: hypothetical protein EZS28_021907 [Streblomastix strix]
MFDINTDKTDIYTKTETDTLFEYKTDKFGLINSYSKTDDDAFLLLKADKHDTFSKTETETLLDTKANVADIMNSYYMTKDDVLLLLKADKSDTYIKTEADVLLDVKADKTELIDSYSKTEDDALLLLKADKSELIDSYSKTEDDALSLFKANFEDLTNYVDSTSAQSITAQKQFGIISVSSISKQSKNDASILLAGGGDMLVSSLVTQQYFQEVRDIASEKSKAYVYSTQVELNDWMVIQENVAKLVIVDNLYIVDKEVTDYWCDRTDLKILETEVSDMSNVITTLGSATGE